MAQLQQHAPIANNHHQDNWPYNIFIPKLTKTQYIIGTILTVLIEIIVYIHIWYRLIDYIVTLQLPEHPSCSTLMQWRYHKCISTDLTVYHLDQWLLYSVILLAVIYSINIIFNFGTVYYYYIVLHEYKWLKTTLFVHIAYAYTMYQAVVISIFVGGSRVNERSVLVPGLIKTLALTSVLTGIAIAPIIRRIYRSNNL